MKMTSAAVTGRSARTILSVLDTLRAHGGAWCMVGPYLRQPPCAICIPKGVRANCQEH